MYYMCSAKSIIVVCCSKHSQCVRAGGSRGDEGKHSVRSSSTVSLASVSWNCYCAKAASAVSQSVSHSLSSGVCPPLPDRLHTAGFSRSHGCPLRVSLSLSAFIRVTNALLLFPSTPLCTVRSPACLLRWKWRGNEMNALSRA